MRRWVARAKELSEDCEDGKQDSPEHARKILAKKNLLLFHEMVKESGSPDLNLASDIANGFDIMGTILATSIYPTKHMHASDAAAGPGQRDGGALEAAKRVVDPDISAEVYRITLEERDKGWLRGE